MRVAGVKKKKIEKNNTPMKEVRKEERKEKRRTIPLQTRKKLKSKVARVGVCCVAGAAGGSSRQTDPFPFLLPTPPQGLGKGKRREK